MLVNQHNLSQACNHIPLLLWSKLKSSSAGSQAGPTQVQGEAIPYMLPSIPSGAGIIKGTNYSWGLGMWKQARAHTLKKHRKNKLKWSWFQVNENTALKWINGKDACFPVMLSKRDSWGLRWCIRTNEKFCTNTHVLQIHAIYLLLNKNNNALLAAEWDQDQLLLVRNPG